MRIAVLFPLVLTILAVAACGGGSGGVTPADPTPNPDPDPDPDPGTDTRTQEILQDCLPAALLFTTEWSDRMQAVFAGTGSTEGIAIVPGGIEVIDEPDLKSLTIGWFYDPTGTEIEGGGSFTFVDGDDVSVLPFAQVDLDLLTAGEDIDTLGAILPNIVEGTHLVAEFNSTIGDQRSWSLDVTFTGGSPGTSDGIVTFQDPDCNVGIDWTGIAWADLLADLGTTFPTGVWDLTIAAGADTVSGAATFDGTRTATATVSRNGEADTNWEIDLVTGAATQV